MTNAMRVVLILGGLAVTCPAWALDYVAPGECPDEAAFVAAVAARTSRDIPESTAVRVRAEGAGHVGELIVDERRRSLHLDTCEEVVSALALSLALQLEREEPAAPVPPELPPPTPRPTAQPPLPVPLQPPRDQRFPRDPRPPAPQDATWHVEGGLGLAARWGRGPHVHAEPSVFVGFRRVEGWWSFDARIAGWLGQSGELVREGPGTARFSLAGARLQVCPVGWSIQSGAFRGAIHPCADLDVGRITGIGKLASVADASAPWLASGATLRLEVQPAALLTLEVSGGMSVPLAAYRLVFLAPKETVYDVPRAGASLGGSVFVQWP